MYMKESTSERGVRVVVSNSNLASGWDVINVDVNGRQLPPTRVGEFATAEEAEKAGYERGNAYLDQSKSTQP